MAKREKRRGPSIHHSIKSALGYEVTVPDNEVYEDWKKRTSRVCKPCWELKYCPYGPLVEQLPLLPSLRESAENQQLYFKECLENGLVGEVSALSDERRSMYEEWLQDEDLLQHQALNEIRNEKHVEQLEKLENKDDQLIAWLGGELPPPHIYRVNYDLGLKRELLETDFPPELWREILERTQVQRQKLQMALKTGVDDNRGPMDSVRRAWFEKVVADFVPDEHPDKIPEAFSEASCTVFGHICPVFFTAEAMTETQEERRIGRRALNFATMMRIVRRDDYRCQHCEKKLQDNEVEFDHVIPVSKGGSSAEHNIRLTCFDCNRDKGDEYTP